MGFAKLNQLRTIAQSQAVIVSTDAETLSINGEKMSITNNKNKSVSLWLDTDGNGKFDTKETTDMNSRKTVTKLNESKNDVKTIENILLDKYNKIKTDETQKKKEIQQENRKVQIDGKIDKASQGSAGDCWLIAGLNSLAHNKAGAQMIKEAISVDKSGSVTVKLKGTGEIYKFSAKEIKKAEYRLSSGDDDVRVIEMAMEKHREKLIKNGSNNFLENFGFTANKKHTGAGTTTAPLNGGNGNEFFEVLTGKKTERCRNGNFLQIAENKVAGALGGKDPNYYLNELQKDPKKYSETTGFRDNQGSLIVSDHAYSIVAVDDKTVSLINPYDNSKIIKMKREAFLKNCDDIDICDLTKTD